MSIQDENDLAARLSVLLDTVEPGPAPVAAAKRQGRGIRVRRRVAVAAGVAGLVAAAAVLPAALRAPAAHPAHPAPAAPLHYTVTVQPPAKGAPAGTIAEGTTDGKRWRVILSGSPLSADVTAKIIDVTAQISSLGLGMSTAGMSVSGSWPASFESASSSAGRYSYAMLIGMLRADVARVAVELPDGQVVNLLPVRWKGYRWAGAVLPAGVRIVKAVAYDAQGAELGYSVPTPFGDLNLGVWWAPGQAGPARVTTVVGSGVTNGVRWRVTADIGPWGYCYAWTRGESGCSDSTANPEIVPRGKLISYFSCAPLAGPTSGEIIGIGYAATTVRKVVVSYSDGTSASFPAVWVSGGRVFGYVIPRHVHITGSREYGAAGQLVGTTSAAGWRC